MIETIFKDFTVDKNRIPIAFLNYTGKANTYLTYYTWHEKSENFYDDDYHAEIVYGTIDIFSKGNFKNILKQVKNKLKQDDITWTDNGPEDFDKETGFYHVPVNFYYENNI